VNSRQDLLDFAAHGEIYSHHPIARSIREEFKGELNTSRVSSYEEITGFGVKSVIDGKEVIIGSSRIIQDRLNIDTETGGFGTFAHVAIDGMYEGHIGFHDALKESSYTVTEELKKAGIDRVAMLTGDLESSAKMIAGELGMDEYHARLLPADKLKISEQYKAEGRTSIAVGDGINDAPLLASADIGIAMGALGSDAAVESADVVLTTDEPSKVAEIIRIAHKTKRVVWQNIFFSLVVKGLVLILGSLGLASMYQAIFADVGVALFAILNAARIIGLKPRKTELND
jgi:Cd2+/Zn2+-exporting ATPase